MSRLSALAASVKNLFAAPARRRTETTATAAAEVESLEGRALMTGISLSGGTLYVDGSNASDRIDVWYSGNTVQARVITNGFVSAHRWAYASQVGRVSIAGYNGNDTIVNNTSIPDTIFGGNHNDVIYGGFNRSVIYGESGHDSLYGRDGSDTLIGGTGSDALIGGWGTDYLYGGYIYGGYHYDNEYDAMYGEGDWDYIYGNTYDRRWQ